MWDIDIDLNAFDKATAQLRKTRQISSSQKRDRLPTNNANEATQQAKTATSNANLATQKANTAATNADNARKGLEEIKSATESATANANKAATNANEKAQKAETAANNANTQANRAKEQADNPPKMGENGNWWKWDETQKKYVDTGILAKGGILYPTFTIDPDTMELIMYYQDDIAADIFDIDNEGFLIFNPK
jgi:hypothetical protein